MSNPKHLMKVPQIQTYSKITMPSLNTWHQDERVATILSSEEMPRLPYLLTLRAPTATGFTLV